MSHQRGTPFSISKTLNLAASGTLVEVLVSGKKNQYPALFYVYMQNDDADYIEIAWRDEFGTLFPFHRHTLLGEANARQFAGIREVPNFGNLDLVSIISDTVGSATGKIKVEGEVIF